jgi:hypothetical protein
MSKVAIKGATTGTGTLTIESPATNTDRTLTLPDNDGTIVTTGGASSLTTSGNLAFTGTGNRITGDFSNATVANRVAFQTSTVNQATIVSVAPNGSGSNSLLELYATSDLANTACLRLACAPTSTEVAIASIIRGTGTYLPMTFYTGGSERMRIDTSGNLLVGTTSALAKLDVRQATNNTAAFIYKSDTGTGQVLIVRHEGATGATARTQIEFLAAGGASVGSITSNGTSTSYNPSSDRRLKENIQPIKDGIERVMKLKPVTYNWKASGQTDDGFIAQDLQEIPEFSHRVNLIGERDGEMYYGVDYMRFVSVLTAAIQEQQAIIESLKTRIEALEGTQP